MEGRAAILDALAAGAEIKEIFAVPDADAAFLRERAAAGGADLIEVAPQVLDVLAETVTPQGVVAVARSPEISLASVRRDPRLVLVLAGVSDPGNAGTLVRTAAAADADAIVFAENSVDPLNPKVVRASAAALFQVPLVRGPSLREVAETMRSSGCVLLGAAAGGKNVFTEIDLARPLALFLGNESGGLPNSASGFLDDLVAVPMPGRIESLNVGIAGSILLFEAVRQRSFRK